MAAEVIPSSFVPPPPFHLPSITNLSPYILLHLILRYSNFTITNSHCHFHVFNTQLFSPFFSQTCLYQICYYSSNLLSGSDQRNQKSQRLVRKGIIDKDHKLTTKNILKIQPTHSLQDVEVFFFIFNYNNNFTSS